MTLRRTLPVLALCLALCAALAPSASAATKYKRIVALTPFTANTLVALGVKPVGYGETVGGTDKFSKQLTGVKKLPLTHPNGPNMEQLAVLNPQLALSSPTWNKGNAIMRQLGVKVVNSDPTKVDAVVTETRKIGALVGKQARAEKIVKQQVQAIRKAKSRVKSNPTVLLVLGVGRTPYAFLPNSWGGDVVKAAGGRLLTEGLSASGGFALISNEYVARKNPDVIIAVPHGVQDKIEDIKTYLTTNPAWAKTNAVVNDRLYISDDNSLLQPWTTVATTINKMQQYLKNT